MAKTSRIYYKDSNKSEHRSYVTALHPDNIVELDETIFHPQGGGQPSDLGTIGGIDVIKVTDSPDGRIFHRLAEPPTFAVGSEVELKVESVKRNLFTRLHSAGHLIAHIVEKNFPTLKAMQGHHFPGEARVEFGFTDLPNIDELKTKLDSGLASAILHAVPVVSSMDETGRKITMGSFPVTPCGGTHVENLGQLGEVIIRSVNKKGDRIRIGYNV